MQRLLAEWFAPQETCRTLSLSESKPEVETMLFEIYNCEIRPASLRCQGEKKKELPRDDPLARDKGVVPKPLTAFHSLFRIELIRTEDLLRFQFSIGERRLPVDLTAFHVSLKQTINELKALFTALPRRRLPKQGSSGAKAQKEIPPRGWLRY